MPTRTRVGPHTFSDFLELIQEDQKADLIDGVIHLASPESLEHNTLVRWLDKVLGGYIDEKQLGYCYIEKVAYRLEGRTGPEPDLAFVRADRQDILKKGYVDGAPDLAIEIVSPDSVDRDYEIKRIKYEAAGVQEYWIIDPDEKTAIFLIRESSGFIPLDLVGDVFHSRVVPGFSLNVQWLWQRPLPSHFTILSDLLQRKRM